MLVLFSHCGEMCVLYTKRWKQNAAVYLEIGYDIISILQVWQSFMQHYNAK